MTHMERTTQWWQKDLSVFSDSLYGLNPAFNEETWTKVFANTCHKIMFMEMTETLGSSCPTFLVEGQRTYTEIALEMMKTHGMEASQSEWAVAVALKQDFGRSSLFQMLPLLVAGHKVARQYRAPHGAKEVGVLRETSGSQGQQWYITWCGYIPILNNSCKPGRGGDSKISPSIFTLLGCRVSFWGIHLTQLSSCIYLEWFWLNHLLYGLLNRRYLKTLVSIYLPFSK